MTSRRGFASDNNSGVHPAILEAISSVNYHHEIGYGDDPHTQKALGMLKETFGGEAEAFLVFTGTAANVLGLSSLTHSYQSIICAETAHIHVDECGAPEKYSGSKLLTCKTPDGKLTVEMIKQHMRGIGFEHHVQPGIISITQVTEMGTLYTLGEIRTLADFAHANDILLHMDGARLSNAAAALNCSFSELTAELGVDVLSFGGTKNGMMYGEAVLFFNPELCRDFKYRRKQGMQLASKMRFMGAQFSAFLDNELWRKNALHANSMAKKLWKAVKDIEGVEITQEVQANAVFAIVPREIIAPLQETFFFYIWDEESNEVRWMCSYDTEEKDIDIFSEKLRSLLA